MAPLAERFTEFPWQIEAEEGVIEITGTWLTVTVTLVVLVHPADEVAVIEYVVVMVGEAVTLEPVTLLNPVAGDQEYVFPPAAESTVEEPLQIVGDDGLTVIVGSGSTVTVTLAFAVQPAEEVPVIE